MNRQWNKLRHFAGDNRGSGIVMVLVCVLCVALMGTTMLFMAYTGLRIRVAERKADHDFYSAETAMDEVKAGLQAVVSDAIGTAYKEVLETYSNGTLITDRFQDSFRDALKDAAVFPSGGGYDVSELQHFITHVSATVGGSGNFVHDTVNQTMTLEGVTVTYTGVDGYTTEISSDITINMPDFAYVMSAFSISGLPEHALIAKTSLDQTIGTSQIEIYGSAYAGTINLHGNSGSKMTVSDGTLVCAGDAMVDGSTSGGRFVVQNDAKLWAGRVVVKGGSSVILSGETRVLDDLELAGSESKAKLEGSYYGFGDGTPDSGAGTKVANRSSAILVNGLNSKLDFSNLNRLMLAGRGYISDTLYANASSSSGGVGMAESVSVRANQQLYLIAPEYLEGVSANPDVHMGSSPAALTEAGQAFLVAHNATMRSMTSPIPGSASGFITYYFLEFNDPGAANQYFEEYFAAHNGPIKSYLGSNSNLNAKGNNTLAYTIRGRDGVYTASQANGVTFDCSGMRSTFNQLRKTLIDANTAATVSNPFDYIVDVSKVDAVNGTHRFTMEDGTRVGIVTDVDTYTVDASTTPDTVRLIIAKNDVVVKADFTGLIICGGTLSLENSLEMKANEAEVVSSFAATYGGDPADTLASYLLHGGTLAGGSDEGVDLDPDGWNLDKLVTYKNWVKN